MSGCLALRGTGEGIDCKEAGGNFGMKEMFCTMMVMVVTGYSHVLKLVKLHI